MVVSKPYASALASTRAWRLRRAVSRTVSCATCGLGLCFILGAALGCESRSVIAEWRCPQKSSAGALGTAGAEGISGSSDAEDLFAFPWNSGFENRFCDYEDDGGRCVLSGYGSKKVVTEPVHSGSFAAEYTVRADGTEGGQSRCFRLGALPSEAMYGAWYYIPEHIEVPPNGHWNLFHVQGGSGVADESMPGLWDVTLVNKDDGSLRLTVYDFDLKNGLPDQSNAPAVPIGEWFHIEMYLKRAADDTGAFALYQDGTAILEVSDITTEYETTVQGQWYVGNLVNKYGPVESTVYVDDVSIVAAP